MSELERRRASPTSSRPACTRSTSTSVPPELGHPAAARHASSSRTPSCRWPWPARARWRSCNDAVRERKVIGVVTQRDPAVDDPVESDLYRIGTLTHIHKMFKFPDGSLRLVVQGVQRFRLLQVTQYRPFLKAEHRAAPRARARRSRRSRSRRSPRARRASSSAWSSCPPPSPTSCRRWPRNIQEPGAPGRLHRRQPALAHHRRRSRRCSRRSTCKRAPRARSTRCWSRTSRCWRSATRSRAR